MAKTMDDYLKEQQAKADAQREADYKTLSEQNTKAVTDWLSGQAAIYSASEQNARAAAEQDKAALPQKYQSMYDANAIEQLINERQAGEKMARMGLTDSGLNVTGQLAANLQRSNADLGVRQTQTRESRSIEEQLNDYISEQEAAKTKAESKAEYDLSQQNQKLWSDLDDKYDAAAANNAAKAYAADQSEQAAALKAQTAGISKTITDAAETAYKTGGVTGLNQYLTRQLTYGNITKDQSQKISTGIVKSGMKTY